jgi:hypothetical protein
MKNHLRRIKRLAGGGVRVCHHHFFLPPAGLEFVIGCASSVTGFLSWFPTSANGAPGQ